MANGGSASPVVGGRRVGIHYLVNVSKCAKARTGSTVVARVECGPCGSVVGRNSNVATLPEVNFTDVVKGKAHKRVAHRRKSLCLKENGILRKNIGVVTLRTAHAQRVGVVPILDYSRLGVAGRHIEWRTVEVLIKYGSDLRFCADVQRSKGDGCKPKAA